MHDVADLVASWQGPDGALPRLTWYAPGAERVELSGRVLANWVVKVANLLAEEADAEPSTTVHLDLPPHWRTLVWAVGAWLTGAQVQVAGGRAEGAAADGEAADGERADGERVTAAGGWDVLVTDRPGQAPDAEVLIAVALPALAMTFDGDLPPGAIDGAADLMTYADDLMMPTEAAGLQEVAGPAWSGPGRVLLPVGGHGADLVARVLSIWRAGASVVLVADPQADTARLASVEGAEEIKE